MLAPRPLGRAERLVALVGSVQMELDEDNSVFYNGSKRAQEPRQRPQEVVLVLRVRHQACAVGKVPGQGQEEEEQGEALTRFFAVVLDNLGDTSTATAGSAR